MEKPGRPLNLGSVVNDLIVQLREAPLNGDKYRNIVCAIRAIEKLNGTASTDPR